MDLLVLTMHRQYCFLWTPFTNRVFNHTSKSHAIEFFRSVQRQRASFADRFVRVNVLPGDVGFGTSREVTVEDRYIAFLLGPALGVGGIQLGRICWRDSPVQLLSSSRFQTGMIIFDEYLFTVGAS